MLNEGPGAPQTLTLRAPTALEELGTWLRSATLPDGSSRFLIELRPVEAEAQAKSDDPGARAQTDDQTKRGLPDWLEKAFALPQVLPAQARLEKDGHVFLVLAPSPHPSLGRLLRRREDIGFFALIWLRELIDFFCRVHESGLLFRRISPDFFSLSPTGKLVFERPDLLRPAPHPPLVTTAASANQTPNLFSAPEVHQRPNGDAQADQFGLALLIYSILAQAIPFQPERLPPLRVFVPSLPHGIESAILRALSPDPQRRFESCRAFGDALLAGSLTLDKPASAYQFAASTEIGRLKCQSMPVNQDAWFIGYDATARRGLLLVADGISTADVGSGDLASAKVFEAVRDAWEGQVGEILRNHTGILSENWHRIVLEAILDDANTRIFSFLKQPDFVGRLDPMTHPPGSTAILAILDGDQLTVATVGDSCLYLLRNGLLELHSVEQNLYTRLVQERHDPRDVTDMDSLAALTHSIGNFFFDNDGGISLRRLEPRLLTLNLCAGDRLLMCSDGVPDCLGPNALQIIQRELSTANTPQTIANTLCKLADESLGVDNITALVLLAE
jgi:serine/threonine protein phosphatase PrpC